MQRMASIISPDFNYGYNLTIIQDNYSVMTAGSFLFTDSSNILVISYEDLKKNTGNMVKKIASFLGYSLNEEVVSKITEQVSFQSMKSNPACNNSWFDKYRRPGEAFMRKGVVGDWKTLFTAEQSAIIDTQLSEKLAPLGIKFDFDQ